VPQTKVRGKFNALIHPALHVQQYKNKEKGTNKETPAYKKSINSFNNRKSTATN